MRKKVAVFSTSWNDKYSYRYLCGVWKTAQENDIDVYVFNTYGDAELHIDFNRCEYNIFNLPDLELFDGILVISNNVGSAPWVEGLRKRALKLKIPCIAVEQDLEGFHYMGTDNYAAMRDVVEYLIKKKGCKVLNYVGGPSDNSENILRKKAFVDVLKENHLVCEEARIRDYSFRREDGQQAYNDFKELGLEKADAIVCANDYMALGYWLTAMNDGLTVPKDLYISGFDNTAVVVMHTSIIITIDRTGDVLGNRSMQQLVQMMEGEEVGRCTYAPHKLIDAERYESPAMQETLQREFWQKVYDKESKRDAFDYVLKHFRLALLENQSKTEFYHALLENTKSFGIDSFCFCMDERFQDYENKEEIGYSQKVEICGTLHGEMLETRMIDTRDLIPEEYKNAGEKSHIWLFTPNHCAGRIQGYSVIMDNLEIIKDKKLYNMMMILNSGLEGMRQNVQLVKMNEELNRLYCMDQMTDLYNRFALEEKGEKLFKKNIEKNKLSAIIFIDMDSLKMVNDIFGHAIGDICLKIIADAIKASLLDKTWFGVRYGGDEFLALGTIESEEAITQMISAIHKNIQTDTRNENFSFQLTASIGYVVIPPDEYKGLEYHIKVADADMYKIKKSKKCMKK